MLFNLSLKNSDGSLDLLIASGSSWSNCISYAEGTGKEIIGVSALIYDNFILNNSSLSGYYQILLKNESSPESSNTIIYDTFENVSTWAQSQSGYVVTGLQFKKMSYITI